MALNIKTHSYVLRDCIMATILAVVLGFLVDIIFPLPNKKETMLKSVVLLLLQAALDSIIIFYYASVYKIIFKNEPDIFYGYSVFVTLFFLSQQQLLFRLERIYFHLSGRKLF